MPPACDMTVSGLGIFRFTQPARFKSLSEYARVSPCKNGAENCIYTPAPNVFIKDIYVNL
jgi:hypothetical protein